MTAFALNPALDVAALARDYAVKRRLQIRHFLDPACAAALLGELEQSQGWRLAVNRGEQIIQYSEQAYAALSDEQKDKLERAVTLSGRYGFQFRYDTIRLPARDEGDTAQPSLMERFSQFLSSPEIVAFLRELTGAPDIDFADAHASRYRADHFLTAHDDEVDKMGRRAAYVMNLTREWRADWGGLLLFHDRDGNIGRGYTPGFNILNLFAVPQRHSVSWVTPLAAQPRYAITGWLRSAAG